MEVPAALTGSCYALTEGGGDGGGGGRGCESGSGM